MAPPVIKRDYFNSVLLSVIVLLMGWTVKGVQELKEQGAATAVALQTVQVAASKSVDRDELLAAAIKSNELDVVRIKQRLGM